MPRQAECIEIEEEHHRLRIFAILGTTFYFHKTGDHAFIVHVHIRRRLDVTAIDHDDVGHFVDQESGLLSGDAHDQNAGARMDLAWLPAQPLR